MYYQFIFLDKELAEISASDMEFDEAINMNDIIKFASESILDETVPKSKLGAAEYFRIKTREMHFRNEKKHPEIIWNEASFIVDRKEIVISENIFIRLYCRFIFCD